MAHFTVTSEPLSSIPCLDGAPSILELLFSAFCYRNPLHGREHRMGVALVIRRLVQARKH